MIMVNGHNKARALRHGVEEPVNHMWTISCLQQHPHAIIVCDEDATDELKHGTYKYFKDIEKDNLLSSRPFLKIRSAHISDQRSSGWVEDT